MRKRVRKAVMLVEDDAQRRRTLYEILRLTKVDVLSAVNSEEAMEVVRREHPELILLNMFSDETGGIDFLKQLRCFGLGQKIVVLGMVGDEDEATHKAASLAEPDKLLERDPPPHLVLELVAGYLKIEVISVPANMRSEVGQASVDAAPQEALEVADVDKEGVKPIIKSLSNLLRLTDHAGKK